MTDTSTGGLLGSSITRERLQALSGRATTVADRPALDVEAPFTGDTIASVPHSTAEDVRAALAAAHEAQRAWAARPVAERAAVAQRVADLVLAEQDEILDIMQLEAGKARRHAFEEVLDVALACGYYARTAATHLAPQRRGGALPLLTRTEERRHPKGVVAVIAPWNYPLTLSASDAVPALVAGNAVVVKPDVKTPFTALWVAELLERAGLPPDVFHVVTGPGSELGTPLIEGSDYLMFTGSTATGRIVARQAAEQLVDYSMELGGKNALLVLADADLRRTVPGTTQAAFSNAGQLCISAERVYVDSAVWDRYVPKLVEATRGLRLGADLGWDVEVGSLASADQLATVQRHVDDAVAKGATVLVGGRHRPDLGPYVFEPTLLTGVEAGMELYEEETFGPVVALARVGGPDEAVARANASRYGLSFSVWTRDTARGRDLAARLRAGTVTVNDAYGAAWGSMDAPMGGMKDSGVGRRHGATGILKYTEPQTIAVQRLAPIGPPPFLAADRYARAATAFARLVPPRAPGLPLRSAARSWIRRRSADRVGR